MARSKLPSPEAMAKQAEVVKLRRGGLTWDLIAQRLGYADASGAYRAYQAAARNLVREDINAIRQVEEERLDIAQSAIWGGVLQGNLPAVQTLIRIMERRAKLLGLDAPTQVSHTVSDAMQVEIERLALELGVHDPDAVTPR